MSNNIIWKDWFAWYPVEIDVYKNTEIKNRQFRYKIWLKWIKRSYQTIVVDKDEEETWTGWKYKL